MLPVKLKQGKKITPTSWSIEMAPSGKGKKNGTHWLQKAEGEQNMVSTCLCPQRVSQQVPGPQTRI